MLKQLAKNAVRRFPSVSNPIWKLIYPRARRDRYETYEQFDSRAEAFRNIFLNNWWEADESRSGWGSTMAATAPLRRRLPGVLRKLGARSLLDAPCGDFHWMRHVDLGEVAYIGADIVPEIISELSRTFAGERRRFEVLDIVVGPMPVADVWLCRDVLAHLPLGDIKQVLSNFADSEVKFLLAAWQPLATVNRDMSAGGFRTINLRLPPFNLPRPLLAFDDFVVPATPQSLGLWSNDQLRAWRAKL